MPITLLPSARVPFGQHRCAPICLAEVRLIVQAEEAVAAAGTNDAMTRSPP